MDHTGTSLSRLSQVLLVGAPLLLLAGSPLLVRFDDQDWDSVLTDMAAAPGRSNLGWSLALLATALLVPAGIALAGLVRGTRPRTAAVVTVTTALGWVGAGAICYGGLVMGTMAAAPDREALVAVLVDLNDSASNVAFFMSVLGAVGSIALGVALARSRVVPVGAAVLVGLGGAVTLLVMAGPIRLLLVVGALLLLAGHLWVVAAVRSASAAPAEADHRPAATHAGR